MDTATHLAKIELANTYARYFVQDFSLDVVRHLSGSHPADKAEIQNFISNAADAAFAQGEKNKVVATNSMGRFLYECASHALESHIEDPAGLEAWNQVSALPSIHHAEIKHTVFESASLYKRTVDTTLLSVIARDAHIASKSILQTAQARITSEETGGSLHSFNWGILNDGLWLSGALLRAFDLASIYRAGDTVVNYWTTSAFNFARQNAAMLALSEAEQSTCAGELDMLLSHVDQSAVQDLMADFPQANLNAILFTIGTLESHVRGWERGLNNTTQLVWAIKQLTIIASLLSKVIDVARQMPEDDIVSPLTRERLSNVYDVVVLALAGYQALRETRFAETLIIEVVGNGTDPKVDVIVNADMINSYHAAGGQDAELIQFGLYLDPRRGQVAPSDGWKLSFILARRDDVIPQIIGESEARLGRLRDNDNAFIQKATIEIVTKVVMSYLETRGINSIRPDISQNIAGIARRVTSADGSLRLDEEIIRILVAVLEDTFLEEVSERLIKNLNAAPEAKPTAALHTIAETAVADVVGYISLADDSE